MKIVVNKQTRSADYYIDDTPILQGVACASAGSAKTQISQLYFFVTDGTTNNTEYQLYFDNLKVYEVASDYFTTNDTITE